MIKFEMIKFHIIAMLELLLWSLTNMMVWVQFRLAKNLISIHILCVFLNNKHQNINEYH